MRIVEQFYDWIRKNVVYMTWFTYVHQMLVRMVMDSILDEENKRMDI